MGLGVLVAVFAAADSSTLHGAELLGHRIGASLTVGAGLLALALVIALAVRPRRPAEVAHNDRARKTAFGGARALRRGRA